MTRQQIEEKKVARALRAKQIAESRRLAAAGDAASSNDINTTNEKRIAKLEDGSDSGVDVDADVDIDLLDEKAKTE